MESVTSGALVETACDTFCWIGTKNDVRMKRGQALLFMDAYQMTGQLQGLMIARVVHPELGIVECLAHELKKVENANETH